MKIKELYNLEGLKLISQLGGFSSSNFKVSSNSQQFVLKKHNFSNYDDINRIEKISFYLNQSGIPVVLPIINKNNLYYFTHRNTLYTLYPMADGVTLHENTLSKEALCSAGDILAKLHRLTSFPELNLTCEDEDSYEEILIEANNIISLINSNPISEEVDNNTKNLIYLKLALLDELSEFDFENILQFFYKIFNVYIALLLR